MKSRSPLAWALLAGLAVLLAAAAPVLWQMLRIGAAAPPAAPGLPAPWQIERGGRGEVRAFGLELPGSTLGDARARWGDALQIAVIESPGQAAALEAYVERWTGGGVTGRLVLAADATGAVLARWTSDPALREPIEARAWRWRLRADDLDEALRSAIVGLSFLPAARIDGATLQARFGAPAEVLPGEGGTRHWLYPDRGLAIAWDEGSGRALLQLVTADDFERRLRAPLTEAASPRPQRP